MIIPYEVTIDTQETSDTTIALTWKSGVSYQRCIIYRSIDSTDSLSFSPIDTPSFSSSYCEYTDSTVTPGIYTRYYYRIARLNTVTSQKSLQSKIVGGTLKPRPYTDTLQAVSFPDSVVLSWKANPGALSYPDYCLDQPEHSRFMLALTKKPTRSSFSFY